VFHNVAEKLTTYALGRSLGFADREDMNKIIEATRTNGGGLRTMVETLVMSPEFRRP
ncbi:MAG: DUF1585 domain-containing protein, partial [Verrucomicrobiaceae bacterium]|nr:DUF1585 domain-containing protein [Verrucomicrobiaceae bacterium]